MYVGLWIMRYRIFFSTSSAKIFQIWTVGGPQVWWNESECLPFQKAILVWRNTVLLVVSPEISHMTDIISNIILDSMSAFGNVHHFHPQDQWISGSFSPTSTGPRTPSESQHWRTMVSQPYRRPIPPGSAHEMLSLINALKLCFTGLFCALSTAYVWSPKQSLWSIIWSSWILLELNFYMSKAFPSSVRANIKKLHSPTEFNKLINKQVANAKLDTYMMTLMERKLSELWSTTRCSSWSSLYSWVRLAANVFAVCTLFISRALPNVALMMSP